MNFRFLMHIGRATALVALIAVVAMLTISSAAWARPNADDDDDDGCKGKSTVPCKVTDLIVKKKGKSEGKGQYVFTIDVKNKGKVAVGGVFVTDQLSQYFKFKSAKSSKGSCKYDSKKHTVRCDIGTLSANKGATITLKVALTSDAPSKGRIYNTAKVDNTSGFTDIKPENNTSTTSVEIKKK